MTELKPCPFCGKKVKETSTGMFDIYSFTCRGCNMNFNIWSKSEEKAKKLWNTRMGKRKIASVDIYASNVDEALAFIKGFLLN